MVLPNYAYILGATIIFEVVGTPTLFHYMMIVTHLHPPPPINIAAHHHQNSVSLLQVSQSHKKTTVTS